MEFDLFLPATFGECAEDENDQWTWTSTAGTTHRLDYVAQSDNFRSNGVRGFVETSVDQCALIIDLWHATSFWLMEKAASGMIGDSLDMIGMRCNRMKRAQCVGECCSTLPVLTGLLTLTHIWHFINAARQCFAKQCKPKKKAWISDLTRWNSCGRSAPPCECGRNFDASGVGMHCKESLWYGELCKVAKSNFHTANAATANVCHTERHGK